ncbi:MAG: cardiolipin synthase [Burkholderiaceae bacterium]
MKLALTIAWSLYLVVLVMWIVLQKRSPAATMSWILSLAALPYAGLLIYYVFGPQKLKRSRLRRLGSKAMVAREHGVLQRSAATMPGGERTDQLAMLVMRSGGYPPSTASNVRLLIDGAQTFEALFDAIAAARHHVHLEYYIYTPDQVGTRLRDLLVARLRDGVKVRLLVDSLGAKRVTRRYMRPFLDAGGELAFFHSVPMRRFRPVVNMRTHRKIVICDGRIGFIGGINVCDEEDERVRADAWRDSHLRIEGLAVHRLQQIFLEDWHYETGEAFDAQDLGPLRAELAPDLEAGSHVMQVVASGPDTELAPIQRSMIAAINAANERVWLTTPYFIPDEASLFALTSAALRGIDLRILVPRRGDSRLVTWSARSYFDELIRAGAKLYEYQPRMLHAKTMLVDDQYAFIGTANFDNRSFRLNFEVSVLLYEKRMNERFAEQFQIDLRSSRQVLRDRRLPWYAVAREAFARLCSPLL